jgi:ribosomal protein S2
MVRFSARKLVDLSENFICVFTLRLAGQNYDIKKANRCLENVAKFRYLGTTITNQNLIQEEIKRRLNSGNAGFHSVQNLSLSSPYAV